MRQWLSLAGFVLLAALAGFVGSRFMPGDWYAALAKPSFNPPNSVFAPVWSVLYLLMAVAAWRAWRKRGVDAAIGLWLAQLVLNGAWSWLFFGRHLLAAALVDILALLVLIVLTAAAFFRRDRAAGCLMVPYIAWVAFASVLNAALWHLNPGA
ncbi:TspO/MBR family protein [Dyella sp.]|jgi:tryptophan-rich sensory protein|uniref:TspO/MBR family protein n=1 Tax=Dyella sp. TaxID=1869338 RepID=UPI002D771562|nr:TspO/MBR family protein [Dyella sp.]HET6432491.1 TspO/MBR family protein [Dyella sp.]